MTNSLYALKDELAEQGIFLCFRGPFSQAILVELGDNLKKKMELEDAEKKVILRVFSMVVENVQNIIYYSAERISNQDSKNEENELSLGIIAVGHAASHYFVLCGNVINVENVEFIREKLVLLRSMNKEELKAYYKTDRKKEKRVDSRGGGLGFIEMAKKASKPIEFDFRQVDHSHTFFTTKTII